mmetsp:Transcript_22917/g.28113  ORF Transcript_22917/g.28113 Transcript_22917/m.28113 type:complete len:748 (+) Transcript_22917:193-2436(+)
MPRSQGTSRKGKPKKADRAAGMGRALLKSQTAKFKVKSNGSSRGDGMAASGANSIGIESKEELLASNNGMKSVLEVDDLTDFLSRAELANREFASEREQFIVVDSVAQEVNHNPAKEKKVQWDESVVGTEEHDGEGDYESKHKILPTFEFRELTVPRRPKWDHTTTPQQLDQNEKDAFLEWRRAIAIKEEQIMSSSASLAGRNINQQQVSVTPFEKNLNVWRQLWRVLERSDCIVLVVDGRNPLFYISLDLRAYVEEELNKSLIVVVNKCDYLSKKQRQMWHDYFQSLDGLEHIFFSAVEEQRILDDAFKYGESATVESDIRRKESKPKENMTHTQHDDNTARQSRTVLNPNSIGIEKPLSRTELLDTLCHYVDLKGITKKTDTSPDSATIELSKKPHHKLSGIEFGMVGFPNVGKSSVLNVLVASSKNDHKSSRVGVAAQPGKTKHFQTLNVPDYENITLCDCPGLVFPSFVSSYADLVLAGVFPLAQVRDYWPAVELICKRIPRDILEAHFGITLPRPSILDVAQQRGGRKGVKDESLKSPTGEELLSTYCVARSLLAASSGIPDYHKASRVVLKDYVTGNILYCHCPPQPNAHDNVITLNEWENSFHTETIATAFGRETKLRDKLGINFVDKSHESKVETDVEGRDAEIQEAMDDLDILDMIVEELGGDPKTNGEIRGKKHKSMQKWGKKGRKTRNKDPYGCHSEVDESMLGVKGGSGLVVNAGKYGRGSYTRPSYKGAKNAIQ